MMCGTCQEQFAPEDMCEEEETGMWYCQACYLLFIEELDKDWGSNG